MKLKLFLIIAIMLLMCIVSFSLFGCIVDGNAGGSQDTENSENNKPTSPPSSDEKPPSTNTPSTPVEPSQVFNTMIVAKTNGVNIRQSASSTAMVLGSINAGDMVVYTGKSGEWYTTKFRNQTAYISASILYTGLKSFEKSTQNIENIFDVALPLLGIKYIYGAERYHWGNGNLNPKFNINAFDCSSFTQYIYYKSYRILLDTTSRSQSLQGQLVNRSNLKRGDIMFFTNSSRDHLSGIDRIGHVGIYFGDNYILHTASDFSVVEPISNTRWNYYMHSRRVV